MSDEFSKKMQQWEDLKTKRSSFKGKEITKCMFSAPSTLTQRGSSVFKMTNTIQCNLKKTKLFCFEVTMYLLLSNDFLLECNSQTIVRIYLYFVKHTFCDLLTFKR
jgi:hypothetical protein